MYQVYKYIKIWINIVENPHLSIKGDTGSSKSKTDEKPH